MSTKWKIIAGPSKFDLILGLFDGKIVTFRSSCGRKLSVQITGVKPLNDEGYEAWSIYGYLADQKGNHSDRRHCSIMFSSKNREGALVDFGPENKKKDIGYIDRMSDAELKKEIAINQESALAFKEYFEDYLKNQNMHDRLVAEMIASQRMVEISLHSQLDHSAYIIARSRKGAEMRRR